MVIIVLKIVPLIFECIERFLISVLMYHPIRFERARPRTLIRSRFVQTPVQDNQRV